MPQIPCTQPLATWRCEILFCCQTLPAVTPTEGCETMQGNHFISFQRRREKKEPPLCRAAHKSDVVKCLLHHRALVLSLHCTALSVVTGPGECWSDGLAAASFSAVEVVGTTGLPLFMHLSHTLTRLARIT